MNCTSCYRKSWKRSQTINRALEKSRKLIKENVTRGIFKRETNIYLFNDNDYNRLSPQLEYILWRYETLKYPCLLELQD